MPTKKDARKRVCMLITKNKNISFEKYIDNLNLQIYWDISRNIDRYFDTKY